MINVPTAEQLKIIPPMYSTETNIAKDIIIFMHFYVFASDWYVSEYDVETGIFYGFTVINAETAHWGPFSLESLKKWNVCGHKVTRNPDWIPKSAIEIKSLENRILEKVHEDCCC